MSKDGQKTPYEVSLVATALQKWHPYYKVSKMTKHPPDGGEDFGRHPQDVEATVALFEAVAAYDSLETTAEEYREIKGTVEPLDLEQRVELRGSVLALQHASALAGMGLGLIREASVEDTYLLIDSNEQSEQPVQVPQMTFRMESPERFSDFLGRLDWEALNTRTNKILITMAGLAVASIVTHELSARIDVTPHTDALDNIADVIEAFGGEWGQELADQTRDVVAYIQEGSGTLFAIAEKYSLLDPPDSEHCRPMRWHRQYDAEALEKSWNTAINLLNVVRHHASRDSQLYIDLAANIQAILDAIDQEIAHPQPDIPPLTQGAEEILRRTRGYLTQLSEM